MDIAVKKVELIEWLVRLQDESIIQRVEDLRKDSIKNVYEKRMREMVQEPEMKLDKSDDDINSGRTHSQQDVEELFRKKFDQ
ncbi:MAG: hypothetical protein WDN75_16740 [Bacteroidota bacterium]